MPGQVHLSDEQIAALMPRGKGHQFLVYGDSCSGIPGGPHEAILRRVNAVASRIRPAPEFVCFLGDEIRGLTVDSARLRGEWDHWRTREMAWVDSLGIPLYNTTGNHTTFDRASEAVFREVHWRLPVNGPEGQEGLSYAVRRGDLLLVFVNTAFSGLGGEGRVETAWLEQTLVRNADARYKLALGHHPIFPVNGFGGERQREVAREDGLPFWKILVDHEVQAYLCSHILAFDAQAHEGVLQVLTAGAGTAARMPADIEYHHCVQAALDSGGLRLQVRDDQGKVREWISWPPLLPPEESWPELCPPTVDAPFTSDPVDPSGPALVCVWRFRGVTANRPDRSPQTLIAGCSDDGEISPFWVGLSGPEQRLSVLLQAGAGCSPHHWYGPGFEPGRPFSFQVCFHTGMGPGGILWRSGDGSPWSSLEAASPWGAEKLRWPRTWCLGRERGGEVDRPFLGSQLQVYWMGQRPAEAVLHESETPGRRRHP